MIRRVYLFEQAVVEVSRIVLRRVILMRLVGNRCNDHTTSLHTPRINQSVACHGSHCQFQVEPLFYPSRLHIRIK